MKLRTVFSSALPWTIVIYIVAMLLAWGFGFPPGSEHVEFVAHRDLQQNHRIVEGDIDEASWPQRFFSPTLATRDDFIGRYAATLVPAKARLEVEKTLRGPRLNPNAQNAIVWVSLAELPPADVATLDVQGKLDVCYVDGDEQCAPYTVEAIACTGKDPEAATCSAGIQIPTDKLKLLLKMLDKAQVAAKPDASPQPKPRTLGIGAPVHVMIDHHAK